MTHTTDNKEDLHNGPCMKNTSKVASIIYCYFLIKARRTGITPLFISLVKKETPLTGIKSIKIFRRCYNDAYYETFILPVELEAHDRMTVEYLAQAPDK